MVQIFRLRALRRYTTVRTLTVIEWAETPENEAVGVLGTTVQVFGRRNVH